MWNDVRLPIQPTGLCKECYRGRKTASPEVLRRWVPKSIHMRLEELSNLGDRDAAQMSRSVCEDPIPISVDAVRWTPWQKVIRKEEIKHTEDLKKGYTLTLNG